MRYSPEEVLTIVAVVLVAGVLIADWLWQWRE